MPESCSLANKISLDQKNLDFSNHHLHRHHHSPSPPTHPTTTTTTPHPLLFLTSLLSHIFEGFGEVDKNTPIWRNTLKIVWRTIRNEYARMKGRKCRQGSPWIKPTDSFSTHGTLPDESVIWSFPERESLAPHWIGGSRKCSTRNSKKNSSGNGRIEKVLLCRSWESATVENRWSFSTRKGKSIYSEWAWGQIEELLDKVHSERFQGFPWSCDHVPSHLAIVPNPCMHPDTRNLHGTSGNAFENPLAPNEPTGSFLGDAGSLTATHCELVSLNTGRSAAKVDEL